MSQLLEQPKVNTEIIDFCCSNCGAILGQTTGKEIIIAGTVIKSNTPLHCIVCKAIRVWRVIRNN